MSIRLLLFSIGLLLFTIRKGDLKRDFSEFSFGIDDFFKT